MLNDILKAVGPAIAGAMSQKFEKGEFRFGDGSWNFDTDFKGVPLDELDLTAEPPRSVLLLGSAKATIKQGKAFRIKASGDTADALRFGLRDNRLTIMKSGQTCQDDGTAELEITLPAVDKLSVAGSGSITSSGLTGKVKATIAGSGSLELHDMAADRLSANVMGAGQLTASGTATKLKLTIAGSGVANLDGLTVDKAKVSVAGSGNATFASDGQVKAHLMGSGDVTVIGRARCSVHSMGSGQLNCVDPDGDGAKAEPKTAKKPTKPKKAKGAKAAKKAKPAKKPAAKRKPSSKKSD